MPSRSHRTTPLACHHERQSIGICAGSQTAFPNSPPRQTIPSRQPAARRRRPAPAVARSSVWILTGYPASRSSVWRRSR